MKTIKENLDDIVFENRNKEYGAYEMRNNYHKRASAAMAIAMFLVLSAVGIPLIASIINKDEAKNNIDNNTVAEITDFIIPTEKLDLPAPPPPSADLNKFVYKAPKIVEELTNPEEEVLINSEINEQIKNTPVDTTNYVVENNHDTDIDVDKNRIFDNTPLIEKPVFPGGDEALLKYIANNVDYPQEAIENNITGTVYLRFVVTKTGKIGEVQIMRSVDPLLDDASKIVIKNLPEWKPGKYNGNPVNVWFVVPIKFELQ